MDTFVERFTSFSAIASDSPLAGSFASTVSGSSDDTSSPSSPQVQLGQLVTTKDGCVILTLHSPLLKKLIRAFCLPTSCTGGPSFVALKPKAVGHLTLAKGRFDSDLSSIHSLYSNALNEPLSLPSSSLWDVVILELVGGKRTLINTNPLVFNEIYRVPLNHLI